jgi:hypothetical protein
VARGLVNQKPKRIYRSSAFQHLNDSRAAGADGRTFIAGYCARDVHVLRIEP